LVVPTTTGADVLCPTALGTLAAVLSINSYTREYVDGCRSSVEMTLAAYENLVAAAKASGSADDAPLEFATSSFEPPFCHHLVLALDGYFGHRARNVEGKDGNPLNEVRILCGSLMHNDGRMAADKTIKMKPEESVLGYRVGDEIRLDPSDFARLSTAFFAEIESRYVRD
jgi:hypothetical protein